MKEIEKMSLIDRIKEKSSRKNRIKGQVKTVLGTACMVALTMGLVTNPLGIFALTVGALAFGGSAAMNAIKVEPVKKDGKDHLKKVD